MRNQQDIDYINHLSKLQAVYSYKPRVKQSISVMEDQKEQKEKSRLQHARFRIAEQKYRVQQENKKMLCALLEISSRENQIIPDPKLQLLPLQNLHKTSSTKGYLNKSVDLVQQPFYQFSQEQQQPKQFTSIEQNIESIASQKELNPIREVSTSSERKQLNKQNFLQSQAQSDSIKQSYNFTSIQSKARGYQISEDSIINAPTFSKIIDEPILPPKLMLPQQYAEGYEQRAKQLAKLKGYSSNNGFIPPRNIRSKSLTTSSKNQNVTIVSLNQQNGDFSLLKKLRTSKEKENEGSRDLNENSPSPSIQNKQQSFYLQVMFKLICLALRVKPRTDSDNDQFFLQIRWNEKFRVKTPLFQLNEIFKLKFAFTLKFKSNIINTSSHSQDTNNLRCTLIQNKGNSTVRIGKFLLPLNYSTDSNEMNQTTEEITTSLEYKNSEVGECLVQLTLNKVQNQSNGISHNLKNSKSVNQTDISNELKQFTSSKDSLPKNTKGTVTLPFLAQNSHNRDASGESKPTIMLYSKKGKRSFTLSTNQEGSLMMSDQDKSTITCCSLDKESYFAQQMKQENLNSYRKSCNLEQKKNRQYHQLNALQQTLDNNSSNNNNNNSINNINNIVIQSSRNSSSQNSLSRQQSILIQQPFIQEQTQKI